MRHWQVFFTMAKTTSMFSGLIGLLALLLGGEDAHAQESTPPVRVMMVEQRLTLRVSVRPRTSMIVDWDEHKGPKCVPARAIAGAALAGRDSIDFVLRNRQRVRARFDSDCDGLDFYGDFYIQPEDQMVCAGRDVIRSRVGGSCEIRKFRTLVPVIARER